MACLGTFKSLTRVQIDITRSKSHSTPSAAASQSVSRSLSEDAEARSSAAAENQDDEDGEDEDEGEEEMDVDGPEEEDQEQDEEDDEDVDVDGGQTGDVTPSVADSPAPSVIVAPPRPTVKLRVKLGGRSVEPSGSFTPVTEPEPEPEEEAAGEWILGCHFPSVLTMWIQMRMKWSSILMRRGRILRPWLRD